MAAVLEVGFWLHLSVFLGACLGLGLGLWGPWLAIARVGGGLGAVVSRVLAPAGGTDVLEVTGSREGAFSPVPGEADSLGSEIGWHPGL